LPATVAPAATSRRTTVAVVSGSNANAGQPAVVGRPATSMLSFTARRDPASGSAGSTSAASAATTSGSRRVIHTVMR
jgi:hypothetical protein